MATSSFAWTRYWNPSGHTAQLDANGYLLRPNDGWFSVNQHLSTFEAMSTLPCLVLLGEPGIGKSYETEAAQVFTKELLCTNDATVHLANLKAVSSDASFYRQISENAIVQEWQKKSGFLYLFLDSVDECLLRLTTLLELLETELHKWPVERLRLRVTCRSAVWPASATDMLKKVFLDKEESQQVHVYELAPLHYQAVYQAAEQLFASPDQFTSAVFEAQAQAFAAKPVTLNLLLRIFQTSSTLPKSRREIYKQGCLALCTDDDERRRRTGNVVRLSAGQRYVIAGRIAAAMRFSNRVTVLNESWSPAEQETYVPRQHLIGHEEQAEGVAFPVTDAVVEECLDTGLFSGGNNRLTWTHQTYVDFLAAEYLVARGVPSAQVISLLFQGGSEDEAGLIPQLEEVAAWLSLTYPDVRGKLLQVDPTVLLRSDVLTLAPPVQAEIVNRLFERCANKTVAYYEIDRNLHFLNHATLASQVRPYLVNTKADAAIRLLALAFVEQCKLSDLQAEVTTLILDITEPQPVRVAATRALQQIGDAAHKKQLIQLLSGSWCDDEDDQLKGAALSCLWTEHITWNDLVPQLTPSKKPNFHGAYANFLHNDLTRRMADADVSNALGMVASRLATPLREEGDYRTEHWFTEVCFRAWDLMDDPFILSNLVQIGMQKVLQYEAALMGIKDNKKRSHYFSDDRKRRQFISAMAERIAQYCAAHDKKDWQLTSYVRELFSDYSLVTSDDVHWLNSRCESAVGLPLLCYTEMLVFASREQWDIENYPKKYDPAVLDTVITRCRHPEVADHYLWVTGPISTDYESSKYIRQRYWREQKDKSQPQPQAPNASFYNTINDRLRAFEKGKIEVWWHIHKLAAATEFRSKRFRHDPYLLDITRSVTWQYADKQTQQRIVNAAERYLLNFPPDNSWISGDEIMWPAVSGYRAFILLYKQARDKFNSLPLQTWETWLPTLLWVSVSHDEDEKDKSELLEAAYRQAPIKFTQALKDGFKSVQTGWHSTPLVSLKPLWDETLLRAAVEVVEEGVPHHEDEANLIETALSLTCDKPELLDLHMKATLFVKAVLNKVPAASDVETLCDERLFRLSKVGFSHAQDSCFAEIWAVLQRNKPVGHSMIMNALGRHNADLSRLDEDQLHDLYLYLCQEYPYAEDPYFPGAHSVTGREAAGHTRNSVLAHLRQQGTPASCGAIRRLQRALPDVEWLGIALREAQQLTRRKMWQPLQPAQVLSMIRDSRYRVVQTAAQLQEVVLEALQQINLRMHDETPEYPLIWNTDGTSWRHKTENEFSDYIKNRLRECLNGQGITLGREVEVRPTRDAVKGEVTDIFVSVPVSVASGGKDVVSVIIEVKGDWHSELWTAMETQLAGRYLRDNSCRHGIYLVGWFEDKARTDLEQAQSRLVSQAAQANSTHDVNIQPFVMDVRIR